MKAVKLISNHLIHENDKNEAMMNSGLRYLLFLWSLVVCSVFCQSCLDEDSDSLLMESVMGAYSTLGTIVDAENVLVESDSYGLLAPVNKDDFAGYADTVGQRVLMEMNFVEQDPVYANDSVLPVKVLRLFKVLSKDADDLRAFDNVSNSVLEGYGSDPVLVRTASLSKAYLNIQFNVMGNDQNIAHRISLLLTEDSSVDAEGLVRVEFCHNAEGDRLEEPFWGVVSFKLSSIPECNDPAFRGFRIICDKGSGVMQEYIVTTSTPNGKNRSAGYIRPLETLK